MPDRTMQPRPAVQRLRPYQPPTGGREGKLRLDFNENTLGCSPAVTTALRGGLHAAALTVYPDYAEAQRELAAFFGVASEELLLTNGTDEAIQVLIHTFVDPGQEVLLLRPCYAMYRFYAELAGAAVREIAFGRADLSFPLSGLLAAIGPATRAILLANPNNPTGTAVELAAIEQVLRAAPQAAVLVDEAYFDFCGITALPRLAVWPNLFVSRTFSKAYGMAGLRCGCLFSRAANIAWLRRAQSPYSVNALAVQAARAAAQDPEYVRAYADEVRAARAAAFAGLESFGIHTYPSRANFILFEAGERASELREGLRRRGILVRDRSEDIPGAVRVTIGTREQVDRFLQELRTLW